MKTFAVIILLLLLAHRAPGETMEANQAPAPSHVRPECEIDLNPERKAFLQLAKLASTTRVPLLDDRARRRLQRGEIFDYTADKDPSAATLAIMQGVQELVPQLAGDTDFQQWLSAGGLEKYLNRSAITELKEANKKIFAPAIEKGFDTALNPSKTYYYWYREPKTNDVMLAIRQALGLAYYVVNASKKEMVAERLLSERFDFATPNVPQSIFFTEEGKLSTAFIIPGNDKLILYNVLEDTFMGVPLALPVAVHPPEVRAVVVDGANYVVVSSEDGFQVFAVEKNLLVSKRVVRNPVPLYNHQVLVVPGMGLQIYARDTKCVYRFAPLVQRAPEQTWECDSRDGSELIKMTAALGPKGEPIAVAVSTKSRGGQARARSGLHILRLDKSLSRHVQFNSLVSHKPPLVLLRRITRDDGSEDMLLSILENNRLLLLDPLNENPVSTARPAANNVRAMSWLDGGFLAFTQRDPESGELNHQIVYVLRPDHVQPVTDFAEDDVGGEIHLRLPDGGWIYLASNHVRARASDGVSQADLIEGGSRSNGTSKAYQVEPGVYMVAVNSFGPDGGRLNLMRLYEQVTPGH